MFKKLLIFPVLIVIVVILIIVLSNEPAVPSPADSPESSVPEKQAGYVILYTDSGFSPPSLTIQAGETVIFENQASADFWPASAVHPTHEVYSGTSLTEHCPDGTGSFDACAGVAPGSSWTFTFNQAGTWRYHDHLDASHTGMVIVE
jgi:plastocyanin